MIVSLLVSVGSNSSQHYIYLWLDLYEFVTVQISACIFNSVISCCGSPSIDYLFLMFYLFYFYLSRDGHLVNCEIYGEVQVNSHLSGLPDLTLSFTNPSILNDVRFHPCVRFRPWESHQILSFVPPDGQFKLMSYRSV